MTVRKMREITTRDGPLATTRERVETAIEISKQRSINRPPPCPATPEQRENRSDSDEDADADRDD